MFFRNARGWTQNDVEKALGVSKNYISRVKQGHSTGSGQLFSGLSLLKRVIELKNQPPPKTTRQMVLELEDRVASLEKTVLGRYPEHRPANLELNEPVNSSSKALAAVEGAMEGIQSVGFSLMDHSIEARFQHVRPIIRGVVANVLEKGLARGTCLNVNIPRESDGPLKGVRVCRQAWGYWEDDFEARTDPMGKEYYWLRGRFKDMDQGEDTDVWAVNNGYVSVVPVQFDMTAHHTIADLNTWDHAR